VQHHKNMFLNIIERISVRQKIIKIEFIPRVLVHIIWVLQLTSCCLSLIQSRFKCSLYRRLLLIVISRNSSRLFWKSTAACCCRIVLLAVYVCQYICHCTINETSAAVKCTSFSSWCAYLTANIKCGKTRKIFWGARRIVKCYVKYRKILIQRNY
jgi:hypothetical protein